MLYDISLLAQAYRCMQILLQTLLFKSAAWHGTFDMIISHLSDLTSPSSDWRCQRRWEMMATLNVNLAERLVGRWKADNRLKMLFKIGCARGRVGGSFQRHFHEKRVKYIWQNVEQSLQIWAREVAEMWLSFFSPSSSLITEVCCCHNCCPDGSPICLM